MIYTAKVQVKGKTYTKDFRISPERAKAKLRRLARQGKVRPRPTKAQQAELRKKFRLYGF